ncbi:putative exported protein [Gluconacetobacter diazotrophicus PA1 5]|nr:putative exported protein [Gluconacetobacter diazotrophicus PA1 5]
MDPPMRAVPSLILPLCLFVCLARPAAAQDPYRLVLKDHHFTPDHLDVPAGQRFLITLSNQDDTVDEFESYDMKFEKIVVQGGTITVHAGPLHPGTYKFFDDYHPDSAVGTVTAQEGH